MEYLEYYILGIFVVLLICFILKWIFSNKVKKFQSINYDLDISGRKTKSREEYIDMLINSRYEILDECNQRIADYEAYISIMRDKYINNKFRLKQVEESYKTLTSVVTINIVRFQTRYRQCNYVKTSYKVRTVESLVYVDLKELRNAYEELENYNFSLTRQEIHSKNQRKLMNSDLRYKIIVRDNYTCQKCGKYMPDEVGLHVDHIVPVSKGGKTIVDNLQVLCDKCNLRKGNKK